MADTTVRGRFAWCELMTSNAAGAHSFYTNVLGWKTQAWEQDPSYTMFVAASGPLAGSWETAAGAPHWLPYIGTPDIAATLAQARSLGARMSKDITDMSNGGKYAVLDDPQGAAFGIYQSASEPLPYSAPKRGEFSWQELATKDLHAAFEFYSALFGWASTGEHDMGDMGVYLTFGVDGIELGGMFQQPADMPGGPAWLSYVRVKDVHQTVDKVTASGGRLLMGPLEVPGGDWVAQFVDPQGAVFAVHTLAADLRASQAAAKPAEKVAAAAETKAASGSGTKAKAKTRTVKKSGAAAKSAPKKARGKKSSRKTAAATRSAPKKAAKTSKKAAKKTAKKSAKRTAATAAKKAPRKTARKTAVKAKKKAARKAPPSAKRKKTAAKRSTAARQSKRPARQTAKAAKRPAKARSASKRPAAKRARKAK